MQGHSKLIEVIYEKVIAITLLIVMVFQLSSCFAGSNVENAVRYAIIDGKSNLSVEKLNNIISG